MADLVNFTIARSLNGFVGGERTYILKQSKSNQTYLLESSADNPVP